VISLYTYFIDRLIMSKVEIKCTENGPNLIVLDGNVTTALCRCGGSNNKPYCDGTHAMIGFKAEAKEIKILE
jgi:CDGSH-type Zn-finger protein